MKHLRFVWESFRPVFSIFFTLMGALGALYCLVTGTGGKLVTAFFLIMLLVGASLLAFDETRKNEFFEQHFGSKFGADQSKKKHRRSGKRCPQCQKVIYHKRTVCQHCGYEFPSKKYEEEKNKSRKEPTVEEETASK